MNFINKILTFIFGRKAHSKTSKGKIRKGKYLVLSGRINKGDMVFLDARPYLFTDRVPVENADFIGHRMVKSRYVYVFT